jgi:catechol 2,3-dioxygenase-like lactoylglutathione lyase family enzyme
MELYSPDPQETPSALGHMLQGIQHFGLTTPDLDKSLKFYIEVLGGRLAVGGDGFYGSELHNLLFQQDELKSKEGDQSRELYGVPDIRDGNKDALDVRFIQFGNTNLELLHFRGAAETPSAPNIFKPVSSSVGFGHVPHVSFHLKSDVNMDEFAATLVEESHKRGLTEVAVNKKVEVDNRDQLGKAPESYAITEFPGSFEGWSLIYAKGPNGEQLEFNQVRSAARDNFIKAMEQYNKLNGTNHSWPKG